MQLDDTCVSAWMKKSCFWMLAKQLYGASVRYKGWFLIVCVFECKNRSLGSNWFPFVFRLSHWIVFKSAWTEYVVGIVSDWQLLWLCCYAFVLVAHLLNVFENGWQRANEPKRKWIETNTSKMYGKVTESNAEQERKNI